MRSSLLRTLLQIVMSDHVFKCIFYFLFPLAEHKTAGFYMDNYGAGDISNLALHMAHSHGDDHHSSMATSTATTETHGLFEPHPVNYAMKPEKNLPPTPPGMLWYNSL